MYVAPRGYDHGRLHGTDDDRQCRSQPLPRYRHRIVVCTKWPMRLGAELRSGPLSLNASISDARLGGQ